MPVAKSISGTTTEIWIQQDCLDVKKWFLPSSDLTWDKFVVKLSLKIPRICEVVTVQVLAQQCKLLVLCGFGPKQTQVYDLRSLQHILYLKEHMWFLDHNEAPEFIYKSTFELKCKCLDTQLCTTAYPYMFCIWCCALIVQLLRCQNTQVHTRSVYTAHFWIKYAWRCCCHGPCGCVCIATWRYESIAGLQKWKTY